MRNLRACSVGTLVVATLLVGPAARALVIDAIADTWIRESNPTATYGDDLISVWDGTSSDQRRHGAIVFDLSATVGLNVESVHLELFDRDEGPTGRSETSPLVQKAYLLNPTPPQLLNDPGNIPQLANGYTWEEFATFDEPFMLPLESLGAYDIPVGDLVNGYEASDFASQADINLLLQQRDNNSNLVVFILTATAGERDWGDIEYQSTPPRLVFNEAPSVLGDFSGNGIVGLEDYAIMNDPANWLQEVPPGSRGDINGDGRVDLNDFNQFKPLYLAATGAALGATGHAAVPEPTTWALFTLGGVAYALRRRLAQRGSLFNSHHRAVQLMGALLVMLLVMAPSQAITVTESYDSWVRNEPGTTVATRDNDWLGVYNSAGGNGLARWAVLEFDLSQVTPQTVNDLHMGFWRMYAGSPVSSSDDFPLRQSVAMITEIGTSTETAAFTWEQLNDPSQVTLTPFESLGALEMEGLAVNPAEASRYHFGTASAADRALIQPLVNSGGTLRVVVRAEESEIPMRIDWGDGPDDGGPEHGQSAVLLINEPVPEFVALTLRIDTTSGNMWIANPGVDPAVNTMFDIDGYVIESPAGALNPGGFTGLSGASQGGWEIVAPSAAALSETNLSSSTLLDEGTTFSLGTGYMPGAAEDEELTFFYSLNGVGGTHRGAVEFITSGGLAGDYNLDGVVNAADFVLWRNTLNSATDLRADGSGNGIVGPEDYLLWKDNYGKSMGNASLTVASQVPEPSLGLIAGMVVLGGGLWGHRRRQVSRRAA